MRHRTTVNGQGLTLLYTDHHGWLVNWLRHKLGCSQSAADLAHDTFLRLITRRCAPEDLQEPRAYLRTVAHGLLVNHWRRRAIEQAYLEALAARPDPVTPSPEQRELVLEALERIDRMLDGLPRRNREIFLLSQLDGLTYPRIAEQLDLTVNVVQKAMLRTIRHCYTVIYEDGV